MKFNFKKKEHDKSDTELYFELFPFLLKNDLFNAAKVLGVPSNVVFSEFMDIFNVRLTDLGKRLGILQPEDTDQDGKRK